MEQVSITSAYMWSCVIMVIFLLIAVLIANMILYKPNNTGVTQRRVWFWVLFSYKLHHCYWNSHSKRSSILPNAFCYSSGCIGCSLFGYRLCHQQNFQQFKSRYLVLEIQFHG